MSNAIITKQRGLSCSIIRKIVMRKMVFNHVWLHTKKPLEKSKGF